MNLKVKEARAGRGTIGWEQIIIGRISSTWEKAQMVFYGINLDKNEMHITREVRVSKIIGSLLNFILGFWNDRCNSLHGADEEEIIKMRKG